MGQGGGQGRLPFCGDSDAQAVPSTTLAEASEPGSDSQAATGSPTGGSLRGRWSSVSYTDERTEPGEGESDLPTVTLQWRGETFSVEDHVWGPLQTPREHSH